jgi:hypothetical protein
MKTLRAAKQPAPMTTKLDEKLVASEVLSTIETESHRPSAIVGILSGKYDQNTVLKMLLALEKEGRVERDSKKTWIAKGGEKQQQKKEKEKAKSKGKQKEKDKDKEKDEE